MLLPITSYAPGVHWVVFIISGGSVMEELNVHLVHCFDVVRSPQMLRGSQTHAASVVHVLSLHMCHACVNGGPVPGG